MPWLLYILARGLLAIVWALPLAVVARLGRWGGGFFYFVDARHRKVALENLALAFGAEKNRAEIRRLARENFRRIGENFACAAKTAVMESSQLLQRLTVLGGEQVLAAVDSRSSRVFAVGHFGNFELYARANLVVTGYQFATTYRGLREPAMDRLLQMLRAQSGCLYFERRTQAAELKAAMHQDRLFLGLLADQHAGDGGVVAPFFGHECSTSPAPALLALRYHCPLHVAICYRTGLGRWRIEISPEIPTREAGKARPIAEIARDMNQAFELAIRRDPANWFWVHRRWKPVPPKLRKARASPESLSLTPPS